MLVFLQPKFQGASPPNQSHDSLHMIQVCKTGLAKTRSTVFTHLVLRFTPYQAYLHLDSLSQKAAAYQRLGDDTWLDAYETRNTQETLW